MQIKDMFRKKIDREIQGVIIVGQGEETNVAQELEEYVVTRELQRHFADFFAAYKKGIQGTTPKMGVWISGFFGSGKSHFLKILSYLLQNKQVGDKHAVDYFIEDQKITNQMVLADMQLAANTPSDVILFNIDSKSDSNGKENKDAIVNVFLKVFNEMQGFCGSMPHLADLERRLSEEGRFEEFKEKFEEEYGDPWESSRQDFDFIQDSVVDVLSDMDFMSESAARNWCEKATESYQISIEDFAKRVKSYIDKKGNNHHVVFLVDEIGQYIGDDSKLMLNLQTVTEELGKECMGKAWVIVTSQQDIDSITKVKGNDFSKIQGRFDTRLSLSSANVDAVIKKRILDKTETAAQSLRLLYDQKATIIKNLIVFNDGVEKKLYANAEDFAEVYPFVPYQFNLLASVLTSIRTHGASGKHLSEGERSMLALFKESAMQLMDDEMGAIVPFYRFYDALENFLDHSHSSVIIRAYDNSYINPEKKEKDVFAINVLKTLFLIKYVLEIEANVDNIVSLMITNIDDDRISLKAQVEDALKVLMRQMLIQKNGSIYVFLTDEEQEINNEIEKENVEMPEVITKIAEMIYEDIFSSKKYQYPSFGGRYAFSFNQTVDDRPYKANQNYDIGLRVLTPPYTAYWASDVVLSAFKKSHLVGDVSEPRVGMATANNDRFIRLWFEVNRNKFGINISSRKEAVESRKKWFPFAKGGEQRKWYGNNDTVVNWENDGFEIQNFKDEKTGRIRSHNYNLDYIFSSALTWTVIGTEKTSFRFCPVGFLYSNSGYGLFCNNEKTKYYLLGFMNSKIAASLLKILSPSMGFESGYLRKLPLIESDSLDSIVERVKHCIDGSNAEWDSFEISWDFKKHPLLRNVSTISEAFTQWQSECDDRFNQLKANEEELNRIFIDIYGLQDELTPEVEEKDVTVRKADLQRDIKSLLSYAVGCMFGRYSLDVEGLAYAGGEWDSSKYQSYIPDADNVIPITDEEYLDDDIVSRLCAWLKVVYGADTLEANLDYIAKALGNKGSTSREIIRNYFLNDFFKDHCQTYSVTGSGKRPIYWLFDSGKQNGFKALVYLHRYTPDTIGNLRIDYLHKMQRVYESEINRMQDMMDHSGNAREVAAASKRKDKLAKQLKECREYDEKISHLALSRIELDLDDGVKVNYRKLQTAQDGKFYEVLADSKNIMVKEKK